MKTKSIPLYVFLIIAAFFLTSSLATAADRVVSHPIEQVLAVNLNPQESRIELVVNVTYPNGCYKPVSTTAQVNNLQRSINLTHITQIFDEECTLAIVHQYPSVDLQKLENGTYKVWDLLSARYLGLIVVSNEGVEFDRSQVDSSTIIKEGDNFL